MEKEIRNDIEELKRKVIDSAHCLDVSDYEGSLKGLTIIDCYLKDIAEIAERIMEEGDE